MMGDKYNRGKMSNFAFWCCDVPLSRRGMFLKCSITTMTKLEVQLMWQKQILAPH